MMIKKVGGSVFSYPSLRILLLKIKEIKRKIIFIPLEDLDLSLTGFIPLQAAGLSNGVNLVFWKNLPITKIYLAYSTGSSSIKGLADNCFFMVSMMI